MFGRSASFRPPCTDRARAMRLARWSFCCSRSRCLRARTRSSLLDAHSRRSSYERGTLQVGAGVNLPLGYYVRFEIDGAGGVSRRDTVDHTSGRVDALARFLLDPFAESAWGLSIGGGMSALFASGARTHGYLVVVTDLEAPRIGVLIPALQVGLGGGVRVGVVIRGYQSGRR
jgi:hypothetical protein